MFLLRTILFLAFFLFANSVYAFDHTYKTYAQILRTHAHVQGVDYLALQQQRAVLQKIQQDFSDVRSDEYNTWSKEQQEAFWINVYNASILQLVMQDYPIKSVRNLGLPFFGPWFQHSLSLLGEKRSLRDIENLLRDKYADPRIYFSLSCGTKSCPVLLSEPYVAEKLNRQLDEAGVRFVQDKTRNRFDDEHREIYFSRIFLWHKSEFGRDKKLLRFLKPYLSESMREHLNDHEMRLYYLDYDWDLNDASVQQ